MQNSPSRPRVAAAFAAAALATGVLTAAPAVASQPPPAPSTSAGEPVDLDALFVGAHPDDEAGTLSTFGQWRETYGIRTGVVTITRGEGGGNAVGPEEGPALGLLREAEERRAVGRAGITEVFNLDKVDFYYTVSAPLSQQVWDERSTLEHLVRLVRQTRPEILVTMDPAPSPGNHGNHQEAARLAIGAYYAAADPEAFSHQLTEEGLTPFAPAKILLNRARGTGPTGPGCVSTFQPVDPSQDVYGVFSGTVSSTHGRTWAAIERDAQREYASQGWAVFPDVPTDPALLGCDRFTLVDSRVPYPRSGSAAAAAATAILDGALVRADGAVPLGTGLEARAPFDVRPGAPVPVTVRVTAPQGHGLGVSGVELRVPDGWAVAGDGSLGRVAAGHSATATFTVTAAAEATPGSRARIEAVLTTQAGAGYTAAQVEIAPEVRTTQQLLPQVAEFEAWAAETGVAHLRGFVVPVLTLGSGGSRQIEYVVTNLGATPQSGAVALDLPDGFAADAASRPFTVLAPGGSTSVTFTVTNTDASLPTSVEGGTAGAAAGDYAYTVTTTTAGGSVSVARPALELVPSATIGEVAVAPTLDGVVADGEYPGGPLDISRRWEGSACTSAEDCSGVARLARHADTLHVAVQVRDDVAGTALDTTDCKRHWRTDSVEIAVDPRGASENTSTTFKLAVLPFTAEGPACALRDADNRQGPIAQTAPGVRWASQLSEPFTGYVVEVAIPLAELPAAVDPDRLGLNVLVYDSDTQDRTGQTRIGWSVWGGVQGDPYRWGLARLDGYAPPAEGPVDDPVIPDEALSSLASPQSIEQAVRINVALSGGPAAPRDGGGWLTAARAGQDRVSVRLSATGPGEVRLFVVDASGTAGTAVVPVDRAGAISVMVPLTRAVGASARVLAGWVTPDGGTLASVVPVD